MGRKGNDEDGLRDIREAFRYRCGEENAFDTPAGSLGLLWVTKCLLQLLLAHRASSLRFWHKLSSWLHDLEECDAKGPQVKSNAVSIFQYGQISSWRILKPKDASWFILLVNSVFITFQHIWQGSERLPRCGRVEGSDAQHRWKPDWRRGSTEH